MVQKLQMVQQLAWLAMASAQQAQDEAPYRFKAPAQRYKLGDKVRLNFWYIKTGRPSKRFD